MSNAATKTSFNSEHGDYNYIQAEKHWSKALQKAESLAAGVKIGNHYADLRGYYFNAGICNFQGRMLGLAREVSRQHLNAVKIDKGNGVVGWRLLALFVLYLAGSLCLFPFVI
jgi:hypothetical protein